MRSIDTPGSFKRERKGSYKATLGTDLKPVIDALVLDQSLAACYRDHSLTGEWTGCRECHIKPDLLLTYKQRGQRQVDSGPPRLA
jgi:mRNA interferase YafQ